MKAIVLYDKLQALRFEENVDVPAISEKEALVKVRAAALNRRDFWIQKGQYAGLQFPIILGSDGSGTVERVGSERHGPWIGKEVILIQVLIGARTRPTKERISIYWAYRKMALLPST